MPEYETGNKNLDEDLDQVVRFLRGELDVTPEAVIGTKDKRHESFALLRQLPPSVLRSLRFLAVPENLAYAQSRVGDKARVAMDQVAKKVADRFGDFFADHDVRWVLLQAYSDASAREAPEEGDEGEEEKTSLTDGFNIVDRVEFANLWMVATDVARPNARIGLFSGDRMLLDLTLDLDDLTFLVGRFCRILSEVNQVAETLKGKTHQIFDPGAKKSVILRRLERAVHDLQQAKASLARVVDDDIS